MSYSPTAALSQFLAAHGMVEQLLLMEGRHMDPPEPIDRPLVEGLRGGAAVLMVAAFEGFLRDALPEHLLSIQQRKLSFAKLPDKMRVYGVFGALDAAMKGPRHQPPAPKATRIAAIVQACKRITDGDIDPRV